MMHLYLFRHGEAEAEQGSGTDAQRHLTVAGSRRNRETARLFAERRPEIGQALVSPYTRARETAADLESVLGNLNFQDSHLITPDADVSGVVEFLEQSGAASILLVGHNPLLSRLLSLLVEGDLHSGPGLDTSELVCVTLNAVVPGGGRLEFGMRA